MIIDDFFFFFVRFNSKTRLYFEQLVLGSKKVKLAILRICIRLGWHPCEHIPP